MRYFLKKTNRPKGEYLQIYQSEYIRGVGSRNKSYKAIGYVDELIARGAKDPVAKAQAEVRRLNDELKAKEDGEKARKIGKSSPQRFLGYFVLKAVANSLGDFEKAVKAISSARGFQYDVYELMMALAYARATFPASKRRTHSDILPLLFEKIDDDSYSQVLSCCEYIGSEYLKIIALLTRAIERTYGLDCHETYFDCTNFYFEIDREDDFRRKGPSKENRKEPIVGLALLLDRNMIPIGMRMYRGSDSEKPVLRSLIEDMKNRSNIKGRTVQVADKGLNCANNIIKALLDGDGYIFSRSVRTLSEKERIWMEADGGWTDVHSTEGEVRYRYKECTDEFDYAPSDDEVKTALGAKSARVREKRVLTFNPDLAKKQASELEKMAEKAYGMCLSKAKRAEFGDSAKYIVFRGAGSEAVSARVDWAKVEEDKKLCGYNLLVTSELNMNAQEIYSAYHGLWRIEESFRVMKSELAARPVFMQKMDCIIGHFFICYIACLVIRLLQIKEMEDSCSVQELVKLIRELRVVKVAPNSYLNLARSSDLLDRVCRRFSVPLNNLFFDSKTISLLKLD